MSIPIDDRTSAARRAPREGHELDRRQRVQLCERDPGREVGRALELVLELTARDRAGVDDLEDMESMAADGLVRLQDPGADPEQVAERDVVAGLLAHLADGAGGRVLAEVEAAARERPLAGPGSRLGDPGQEDGRVPLAPGVGPEPDPLHGAVRPGEVLRE